MTKKDFLNYIHYFRGLAILFIVGLHACVTLNWGDGLMQRKVLVVLFNNGTVLFVFIAGFLFFHLNKDRFDYKRYLQKKFLYVIIPYLLVSIPAIIDKLYFDKIGEHWWMDHGFSERTKVASVFLLLATGRHMGVFWFIPMISVIYLLSPVILRFAKTQVFLYVAPALMFAGLYNFRFGYYANIWLSLQYFFPVYLFGIWLYRVKDVLFRRAWWAAVVLISIYAGMCVAEIFEWVPFNETIGLRDVKYSVYRFNFNKAKIILLCIGALLVFYINNARRMPLLKTLGDYSFGIFFVHLYVIQVFRLADKRGIIPLSPPSILTFILYFAMVMVITVAIVKVIKMIFKENSRYVIGS